MLIAITLNLVLATTVAAKTIEISCSTVIESCDKALKEQVDVIETDKKAIDQQKKETDNLKEIVKEKDSQLNSFIRQPTLLVGVGVLTALLGGPIAAVSGLIIVSSVLK